MAICSRTLALTSSAGTGSDGMAKAQDISAVAAAMPGVPRWQIEQRINSGDINPDNYDPPTDDE